MTTTTEHSATDARAAIQPVIAPNSACSRTCTSRSDTTPSMMPAKENPAMTEMNASLRRALR